MVEREGAANTTLPAMVPHPTKRSAKAEPFVQTVPVEAAVAGESTMANSVSQKSSGEDSTDSAAWSE
eukprot:g2143.t1